MDDTQKAIAELKSAWESEFKPRIDEMQAETKTNGEASAETKAAVSRVQDRLDDLEAKAQRAAMFAGRSSDAGEMSAERKAFMAFSRKGEAGMTEHKALGVDDESTGGVLAPSEFIALITKGIIEYSPIRTVANIRPTSARSSKIPKRTGLGAAVWTGDKNARPDTPNPTYGIDEVANHELYARITVSVQDLEDSAVDLEADLVSQMVEQFGVAEGSGFVIGNGVGKPEGFLANADVQVIANSAATFTNGDGLIDLRFSLKEPYWRNARFILNRLTLRDIRKIKDADGNYMWTPGIGLGAGLQGAVPATIIDTPYIMATDMPTTASGAKTVAIGDFGKGYVISDRVQLSWLRDPYTAANTGSVVFHARKRVGGQVMLPEAIKILQMA